MLIHSNPIAPAGGTSMPVLRVTLSVGRNTGSTLDPHPGLLPKGEGNCAADVFFGFVDVATDGGDKRFACVPCFIPLLDAAWLGKECRGSISRAMPLCL